VILDAFEELSWLAVLVAAAAYFVLGAIWYSNAVFGKRYRAALGVPDQPATPPVAALLVNFIGWFVAAIALGLISTAVGADDVWDGVVLGLVVAVGFIGTTSVVNRMFGSENPKLMPINGPYTLIGYALMGAILAVM
jgi:fluoride ion exporter CrcB/FEX